MTVLAAPSHRIFRFCSLQPHLWLAMFLCIAQSSYGFVAPPADDSTVWTIEEAYSLALKHNFDILLAKNAEEAATKADSWAMTGIYPTVGVGASGSYSNVATEQNFANGLTVNQSGVAQSFLQAFAALQWQVFDGLRMFATKDRLSALQKNEELALAQRIAQTLLDVAQTYWSGALLQQQIVAHERLAGLFRERLATARVRLSSGAGNKNDMLQAEIDLLEQDAMQESLRGQIAVLRTRLDRIVGTETNRRQRFAKEIPLAVLPDSAEMAAAALNENYDVLMAQQRMNIAIHERKEIFAQGLPSLRFTAGYNYSRSSNSAGFALFNMTNGINAGFQFTAPLFNGFATDKQLEIADVRLQGGELEISQAKQQNAQAMNEAWNVYSTAKKQTEIFKKSAALAREHSEIAMERFRKNAITSVELRQIQYGAINAETASFQAQYTAKIAELTLLALSAKLK